MSTPATPSGPASTNGWDIVFAIKYADVNQAIIDRNSSPPGYTITTDTEEGTISSSGTFGAWQICEGGDGQNIHMTVPISKGSITFGKQSDFSDAVASIEVRLDLLPQPGATAASGKNDLKVRTTADASAAGDIVSVIDLQVDGLDFVFQALLKQALQKWLEANLQEFNHVFAVVDLAMTADQSPNFNWLLPTYTSYAVTDAGTLDDSIFAVLSMTEGRSAQGLSHEVSSFAIPDGARAGFMITQERFLEKMVLPGVAIMFKQASVTDFDITQDGTVITNNKDLDFHDWILDDGTVVSPVIDKGNFTITLFETTLELKFSGLHFSYNDPGTICIVNFTSKNIMRLDPDHPNLLDLHTTWSKHDGMVETSKTEQWIDIAAGIAIQVFAIVIGVVTAGAGDVAVEGAAGVTEVEEGEAAINEVTTTFSEDAGNNAVGNVSDEENATQAAEKETTATAEGDPNYKAESKGWFARNKIKIAGGMKGALVGGVGTTVINLIPKILKAEATGEIQDLPTLDGFTETAVSPVSWPGAATGFNLTSLALNGPLQLGGNPGFKDPGGS